MIFSTFTIFMFAPFFMLFSHADAADEIPTFRDPLKYGTGGIQIAKRPKLPICFSDNYRICIRTASGNIVSFTAEIIGKTKGQKAEWRIIWVKTTTSFKGWVNLYDKKL
jgi:hypothetical protein